MAEKIKKELKLKQVKVPTEVSEIINKIVEDFPDQTKIGILNLLVKHGESPVRELLTALYSAKK